MFPSWVISFLHHQLTYCSIFALSLCRWQINMSGMDTEMDHQFDVENSCASKTSNFGNQRGILSGFAFLNDVINLCYVHIQTSCTLRSNSFMTCWGLGWYTIGGGENFHHEHPDNYWKNPAHEVSRFCGFLHIYSYMQSLYTQMLGCYSVLARRNIIWMVDIEIIFTLCRNYSSNSVWIA